MRAGPALSSLNQRLQKKKAPCCLPHRPARTTARREGVPECSDWGGGTQLTTGWMFLNFLAEKWMTWKGNFSRKSKHFWGFGCCCCLISDFRPTVPLLSHIEHHGRGRGRKWMSPPHARVTVESPRHLLPRVHAFLNQMKLITAPLPPLTPNLSQYTIILWNGWMTS